MIYFILILLFLYPVLKGASVKNNVPKWYYWFLCITITFVAGFRNMVGGDTINYMRDWEQHVPTISTLNAIDLVYLAQFYRPLVMVIWIVCKSIWSDFYSIQIVVSVVANFCAFYIIKEESKRKYETVFLYLLFQFLYFNMEIMREALAVSVFYFAFRYYDQHKWKNFYLLMIIAFLLHDSSFLFFILPFVHKIIDSKPSLKKFFYVIIVGGVFFNPVVFNSVLFLLPGDRGADFMKGYGAMENATIFGTIKSYLAVFLYYYIFIRVRDRCSSYVQKGFSLFMLLSCLGLLMPIFGTRICNYVRIFSFIVFADFLCLYKRVIAQKILIVLLMFNFYRYYFNDVTDWVGWKAGGSKYYFYELFYPYTSIFEEPDQYVINRRIMIFDQAGTKK